MRSLVLADHVHVGERLLMFSVGGKIAKRGGWGVMTEDQNGLGRGGWSAYTGVGFFGTPTLGGSHLSALARRFVAAVGPPGGLWQQRGRQERRMIKSYAMTLERSPDARRWMNDSFFPLSPLSAY